VKQFITWLSLLLTSTALFAGLGCGYLGVTLINDSKYDCELRNITLKNGGNYAVGFPPANLAKGTTSPTFYLQQTMEGIRIKLDYRCEKKVVSFESQQGTCFFGAGNIHAFPDIANDLSTDPQFVIGSYWSSRPGEMTWRIY